MTDATDSSTPHLSDDEDINPQLDRQVVQAQIGREPRAMAGVAARCVYGYPAVTKQAPKDENGRPFPTAFYLTCPHLVRQIDRLEAQGGVKAAEKRLQQEPKLWEATMRAHDRHAELDNRGSNIAATTNRKHLKCLHAQAAFALAMGDHPLGDAVLADAAPRWCDDAKCASFAAAEK